MYAFCFLHRLAEHFAVQIIPYRKHMAMLVCSQQIACAADFQVPHGDFKAAAKFCVFPDSSQALLCRLFQNAVPAVHQKGIGHPVGTPDSSPELIELGQSVPVRIMDNHGIYVGNIQSRFNNGGGHQHIYFSIDKPVHNFFQLSLIHLPMGKIHLGIWNQFPDLARHIHNIFHPVIDIINLSSTVQLPVYGFPDGFFIVFHHISLNGNPVHGRFFQYRHIPDTDKAHMESPGNWCGCQGEHIHIFLQLLDFFLMPHSETLFFINHQQPQVFKFHIL